MKITVTVFLAALAAAAVCHAQTKLAIVNLQQAIADTKEIRKNIAEGSERYRPREEEINKLQQSIQSLEVQIDSGKLGLSAAREARARSQAMQKQLRRKDQDLREDVAGERNEVMGRAQQRMQQVIAKIAEERGLDLVIDSSRTAFFKPAEDITADAVAAYDKTYPAK